MGEEPFSYFNTILNCFIMKFQTAIAMDKQIRMSRVTGEVLVSSEEKLTIDDGDRFDVTDFDH